MNELNKNKAGLITGSFLGLWHFAWSLLVATGVAQTLLDWVFYLHFLNNPYHVSSFNPFTALLLVAITTVLGYSIGWGLAWLWNFYHRQNRA